MTDKAAFIEQVERQLPPELQPMSADVPDVVGMLADANCINYDRPNQDVKKVIQLLPAYYIRTRATSTDTADGERHIMDGRINANALLNGEFMAEWIKPEIKAMRKAYFGSGEPPFSSLQAAIEWYIPIEKELIRSTYDIVEMGCLPRELEYTTEAAERWWTDVEQPLLRLSYEVGIEQESLKFFLLADIKPLTVPYVITMPGKEYCKGRRKCYYVNVKINTELGLDDLFAIYRTVRDVLGVKRGRRFDEQHLELYTMVQERGGVPTKGVVKFWESVLEEWDARHPGDYKEWRSIRRAYDRLSKKLNAQYQKPDSQDIVDDARKTTYQMGPGGTVIKRIYRGDEKESEVIL